MNEVLTNILIAEISILLPLIGMRICFDFLRNILFKQ